MKLHTYWGIVSSEGNTITLDADRERALGPEGDGIGSALAFMEWDGRPLRLAVERMEVWRPEPWSDLWFMAREDKFPLDRTLSPTPSPWPMRYVRFYGSGFEFGESKGPFASDQVVHFTLGAKHPGRHRYYHVSLSDGVLHIGVPGGTHSLPSPNCELGLYSEACKLRIGIEG